MAKTKAALECQEVILLPEMSGHAEAYGERGVWVPEGMSAAQIMAGATALEQRFDVDHYTARSMVRAVLEAIHPKRP